MRYPAGAIIAVSVFVSIAHGYLPLPQAARENDELKWFNAALSVSDRITILEGLPHPFFEPEERALEERQHPTVKIGRELFYAQALEVPDEFSVELTRFFASGLLFDPNQSEVRPAKQCGGFHADFAVRWHAKDEALATALVCFGCGEIRLINEKEARTGPTFDMSPEGGKALEKKLKPLGKLRPPFRHQSVLRELRPGMVKPEAPKIEFKK